MGIHADSKEPEYGTSSPRIQGFPRNQRLPTVVEALAAAALLHDIGKLAIGNIGAWAIAKLGPKLAQEFQPKSPVTGEFTHLHALCTAAVFLHPDNRGLFPEWLYYDIASLPMAGASGAITDPPLGDTGDAKAGVTNSQREPLVRWSWEEDGEVRCTEGLLSVVDLAARHHRPGSWLETLLAESNRLAHGLAREEFQRLEDGAVAGEKFSTPRANCFAQNFMNGPCDKDVGIRSGDRPPYDSSSWQPAKLYLEFRTRLRHLIPLHPCPRSWLSSLGCLLDDLLQYLPARCGNKVNVSDEANSCPASFRGHGNKLGSNKLASDKFGSDEVGGLDSLWEVSLATHVRLVSALATSLFKTIIFSEAETDVLGHTLGGVNDYIVSRESASQSERATHRNREADRAQIQLWRREIEDARVLLLSVQLSGVSEFLHEEGEIEVSSNHLIGRVKLVEILFSHILTSLLSALELPDSNIMYAGGSTALLILPGIEGSLPAIEQTRSLIQAWFDQECGGALWLTLAPLPVAARSFINQRGDEEPAREMLLRLQDECERREFQPFDLEISGGIVGSPLTSQLSRVGRCPFRPSVAPSLARSLPKFLAARRLSGSIASPTASVSPKVGRSLADLGEESSAGLQGGNSLKPGESLHISALTHDELLLAGELDSVDEGNGSVNVFLGTKGGVHKIAEAASSFGQLIFWDGSSLVLSHCSTPWLELGGALFSRINSGARITMEMRAEDDKLDSSVRGRELVVDLAHSGKRAIDYFLINGAKQLTKATGNAESAITPTVGVATFVQLQRDLQQWRELALHRSITKSWSEINERGDLGADRNFLLRYDSGVILSGSPLTVAKISQCFAEQHLELARFFKQLSGEKGKDSMNLSSSVLGIRAVLYHRPHGMSLAAAWYRSAVISKQVPTTTLKAQVVVVNPHAHQGLNHMSWVRFSELVGVAGQLESWLPSSGVAEAAVEPIGDVKEVRISTTGLRLLYQCAEDREAEASAMAGEPSALQAAGLNRESFRWRTKIKALVYADGSCSSSMSSAQMNTLATVTKWVDNYRGDLRFALTLLDS